MSGVSRSTNSCSVPESEALPCLDGVRRRICESDLPQSQGNKVPSGILWDIMGICGRQWVMYVFSWEKLMLSIS